MKPVRFSSFLNSPIILGWCVWLMSSLSSAHTTVPECLLISEDRCRLPISVSLESEFKIHKGETTETQQKVPELRFLTDSVMEKPSVVMMEKTVTVSKEALDSYSRECLGRMKTYAEIAERNDWVLDVNPETLCSRFEVQEEKGNFKSLKLQNKIFIRVPPSTSIQFLELSITALPTEDNLFTTSEKITAHNTFSRSCDLLSHYLASQDGVYFAYCPPRAHKGASMISSTDGRDGFYYTQQMVVYTERDVDIRILPTIARGMISRDILNDRTLEALTGTASFLRAPYRQSGLLELPEVLIFPKDVYPPRAPRPITGFRAITENFKIERDKTASMSWWEKKMKPFDKALNTLHSMGNQE